MEIIKAEEGTNDNLSKYLSAEEVAEQIQSLIRSPQDLQSLEWFLRFSVLKVPTGSYEGLEQELLQEALTRLLEDRRHWPRGVKPKTVIANVVKSILDDRRNCADALALNRLAPSGDHVEDEDEEYAPVNKFDQHALAEHEYDERIKARFKEVEEEFSEDETAWMIMHSKYLWGYSPQRIQEALGITANEYDAALKRIKRRVAKITNK